MWHYRRRALRRWHMRLWLDTAIIDEIREIASWGILDGVTTNPTLMARAGVTDMRSAIQEIADIVQGPVSAEVLSTETEGMIREAEDILTWSPHVVVKIPTTVAGLKAMKVISSWPDARVNATLIFSANQALLAAKAGATYVSPFIGRLDDAGHEGMQVIREIATIFRNYDIQTQIVAASIRHPLHVTQAALASAHICTMPYKVMTAMVKHPFTDVGLKRFLADWEAVREHFVSA